jgi:hypothetical protein
MRLCALIISRERTLPAIAMDFFHDIERSPRACLPDDERSSAHSPTTCPDNVADASQLVSKSAAARISGIAPSAHAILVPSSQRLIQCGHPLPNSRVYAGIGLAGAQLSEGLPIDVLALIATVEHLRRSSSSRQAMLLIADSNARAAGFFHEHVDRLADRYVCQIRRACHYLNFDIEVRESSSLPLDRQTTRRVAASGTALPAYVRLQLEQMLLLHARGYHIKVGWQMTGATRDESHFDAMFRRRFGGAASSSHEGNGVLGIYSGPGRSFDPARPRACPYVASPGQTRILLGQARNVRAHLETEFWRKPQMARGYRRHLLKIARSLRSLAPPSMQSLPSLDFLQAINAAICGDSPHSVSQRPLSSVQTV